MPFLEHLVATGSGHRWAMRCASPSLSRPMYETLHTGLDPAEHGILTNEDQRPSTHANVFSVARGHGRRTAAAAARGTVALLSTHVPVWLDAGYRALVTSDHGMRDDGFHGGDSDVECRAPFLAVGCGLPSGVAAEETSSLAVAPTVLTLMDLPIPASATARPLF